MPRTLWTISAFTYGHIVRTIADSSPDIIDAKSQEIRAEDGEVYTKMEDLADELPESSPRFILLSYPLTLVCIFIFAA